MRRHGVVTVLVTILLLALPLGALADDPPPPSARHQHRRAGLPITAPAEVVQFVLEFAPGAATPPHTHPGLTVATVLEGEITFETGGSTKVYRTGETLVELPGELGVARNATGAKSRTCCTTSYPPAGMTAAARKR
jgi:quercetin dioxygenase-like cupin family protein